MRRSAYLIGGVALVTVVAGIAVAASATAGTTTYEAESSVNTLAGGAHAIDCRRCSGGQRITGIGGAGSLTVTGVVAEKDGPTRLAVTYASDRTRIAQISVNGGIGTAVRFAGTRGSRPATARITVSLTAGDNTITFGNPAGRAPDVDKIVLTTDGTPPTPVPTGSATLGPTAPPAGPGGATPLPPTVTPEPPVSGSPAPTPSVPPAPTEPPTEPPGETPEPTRPPADPPTTTRPPADPPATTRPPTNPPAPAPTGNAAFEAEVVRLVNVERAKVANCPAVNDESRLQAAARGHSADMAARNYFSHTTPEGVQFATRMTDAGYQWRGAGENIAKGYRTPAAVMEGWMNSAGHKANILNCGFRDLGVGVAADASGTLLWTQDFGIPR